MAERDVAMGGGRVAERPAAPVQLGPAQLGPAQVGPAQVGPAQVGPAQLGPVKVWDGWVRLVHWGVVLLLGLSWWSASNGRFALHYLSGYAVLTLILFRIAWGVVGSDTARFTRFLRSPIEGLRHLRAFPRSEPDVEVGHNAAGGWMVLLLLGLLLAETATGLFSDTGYGDYGPLAKAVAPDLSDRLTGLHHQTFDLLLAAAGLHVTVVAAYALLKGHDLVGPMVTGIKRLPDSLARPRLGSPWLATGLLAVAAAAVWAISRAG